MKQPLDHPVRDVRQPLALSGSQADERVIDERNQRIEASHAADDMTGYVGTLRRPR